MRDVNFNFNLHKAIKESGKNQLQLSKSSGIRNDVISNLVNGRMNPRVEERRALCKALSKSESELFGDE